MSALLAWAAILSFFAAFGFALLWQRVRAREQQRLRLWNAALESLASRDEQRVFALAVEMDSLSPLGEDQAAPGEMLRAAVQSLRLRHDELERGRRDLEDVLASLQDAVLVVDAEAHLRYINAAALSLFNVRIEDVLGAALLESLPSFGLDSAVRAALQEGSSTTREMGIYTPQTDAVSTHDVGGKREILLRVSPVRRGDGRVAGAVAILQDLTEMRRLERVRREFVANASHELRTPIANIRAGAETILCDPEDTGLIGRFLPNIVNESERLSRLVTDLLDLARIESTHQATQNPVDVTQVAESVVSRLTAKAARNNIRVHCDWDEPLTVAGDAAALEQVVFNLLDNALAYTPSGGEVTIRVASACENSAPVPVFLAAHNGTHAVNGNGTHGSVTHTSTTARNENSRLSAVLSNPHVLNEALPVATNGFSHSHHAQGRGERVLVQVADTGIGIPEADLERIFERFYRVDKARSRSQGGTGLGLAIVKHIVENHDGHVTVQSEVGKGTTFIVSLPAL